MYLQKLHYLIFDLDVWVTHNIVQYPLHHVIYAPTKFEYVQFMSKCINTEYPLHHLTYVPAKFKPALSKGLWMYLQENTLYELDLGVRVMRNVFQYPSHHVTYAPATFEDSISNGLGDAIT